MIDFLKLPSPCYVLDEELLDRNLATVDRVRRESGAEIIVALKACAMWSIFPELAKHSDGATASSAAEARLVFEEFGRPAHTYAPVYTDSNIDEILNCSDHITFNSLSQFRRFGQKALINGISCGLRINPQYSPVETDLYNPCVPARGWASRPNSWRRTADFRRVSRGCISTSSANRARSICKRRWRPSRRILERISTGSNGSTWAAAT